MIEDISVNTYLRSVVLGHFEQSLQFGELVVDGILADGCSEGGVDCATCGSRVIVLHFAYFGADVVIVHILLRGSV